MTDDTEPVCWHGPTQMRRDGGAPDDYTQPTDGPNASCACDVCYYGKRATWRHGFNAGMVRQRQHTECERRAADRYAGIIDIMRAELAQAADDMDAGRNTSERLRAVVARYG